MSSISELKPTRVVFVEPAGAHANVFSTWMTIPMLGPLYLGTLAEQAGYHVTILNENILGRQVTPDELVDADILCLSCMTATVQRGKAVAKQYRELRAVLGLNSRSIIGGIHASMIPEDVVDDFDQVFVGEAESRFLELLSGDVTDKIVHGQALESLDSVPIANFKLLKHWQRIKVWPVMTSRGCPYDCTFCSVTEMFGRGYRTKSVDRVIEEVRAYDHRDLFFVDDHFVVNKKRTHQILVGLKGLNRKLNWSAQLRTEVSKDAALVADMREAGCRTVHIGFESINPESLKEIHKGHTVEDIKRSVKVFKDNGILVHGMFMFGSDSDHQDVFQMTSDFCKTSGVATVQYMVLTPLPGTRFYRRIEQEGRLLHKNWEYYDAMHVVFQPKHLTPIELQQGMIDCFSDFYCYTKGIHDAVNAVGMSMVVLFKRMYQRAYYPSFFIPTIKILGKGIVRAWLKHNRPYLAYLHTITLRRRVEV
jgi:radical SAM superfamily enzyme YgiQ (UPF0313 family)